MPARVWFKLDTPAARAAVAEPERWVYPVGMSSPLSLLSSPPAPCLPAPAPEKIAQGGAPAPVAGRESQGKKKLGAFPPSTATGLSPGTGRRRRARTARAYAGTRRRQTPPDPTAEPLGANPTPASPSIFGTGATRQAGRTGGGPDDGAGREPPLTKVALSLGSAAKKGIDGHTTGRHSTSKAPPRLLGAALCQQPDSIDFFVFLRREEGHAKTFFLQFLLPLGPRSTSVAQRLFFPSFVPKPRAHDKPPPEAGRTMIEG